MSFKRAKNTNLNTITSAYSFKVVANPGKYLKLLNAVNMQQEATDFALAEFKRKLIIEKLSLYDTGSQVYHQLKISFPDLSAVNRGAICQSIVAACENGNLEKLNRTDKITASLWFLKGSFNLQNATGRWNLWCQVPVEKISASRYGTVNFALAYNADCAPLKNAVSIDRLDIRLVPHKGKKALYAKVTVTELVPEFDAYNFVLGADQNFKNIALSTGQMLTAAPYLGIKTDFRQEQRRKQASKEVLGNKFKHRSTDYWRKFSLNLALTAKRLGYSAVSVEDLKNIRKSSPSVGGKGRRFNYGLHNCFPTATFQAYLERALRKLGIRFIKVVAKYTSQTCSSCGHRDKKNRKSQARFVCTSCGFAKNADLNAAVNISRRGLEVLTSTLRSGDCWVQSMSSLAASASMGLVNPDHVGVDNPTVYGG